MSRTPGFRLVQEFSKALGGTREAVWALAEVHVKYADPNCSGTLWRELVASRLASACGLPVPPGDVGLTADGRLAWITARITNDGEEPPPSDPRIVIEHDPATACGIFVFDCWTANLDRHEGNLLFAKKMGVWMIDHEHSFGASEPGALNRIVHSADDHHVFLDGELDEAHLNAWIQQIRCLPMRTIRAAVREAQMRRLINASQRDMIIDWLRLRRNVIRDLVLTCRSPAAGASVGALSDTDQGGLMWTTTALPGI